MTIELLDLDFETYSDVPIKHGTHKYAENAEQIIFAYGIDNKPPRAIDLTLGCKGDRSMIDDMIMEARTYRAHNSHFDRTIMAKALNTTKAMKHAATKVEAWRDTMVQAMVHGLPGKLETLCDIFKIDADKAKDKRGKALIRLFCMPRKFGHSLNKADFASPKDFREALAAAREAWLGRATGLTHPNDWYDMMDYATDDIVAMRQIGGKLPTWNYQGVELALWHMDQHINDRGTWIDLDLVQGATRAVSRELAHLAEKTVIATQGEVSSTNKRDKLILYILKQYGIVLPDLKSSTVEEYIDRNDIPPELRALLVIRIQASTTSTSKYNALLRGVSKDGRLRGLLQYAGALRTLRWAGRLFQPQNLPRPTLKKHEIDEGIQLILADVADLLAPDVMRLCSSAIRGTIAAPPGKKLVIADLSNIEGRGQAWLAGEKWKLQAFRDYDTILTDDDGVTILDSKGKPMRAGPDLYKLAYGKAFNIHPDEVEDEGRQIGKVMELGCFAPDTRVLTDSGVKAIVEVLITDKLWDGVEWVAHSGVCFQGMKETINLNGIGVTPDHLILTGQTWKQARQLVSNPSFLQSALATGSDNLPSPNLYRALLGGYRVCYGHSAIAEPNATESYLATCARGRQHPANPAPKRRPDTGVKSFTVMPISFQNKAIEYGCSIAYPLAWAGVTTQRIKTIQIMANAAYMYLKNGALIAKNILRISSPWRVGTCLNWSLIESALTKGTNPVILGSSRVRKIKQISAQLQHCKPESQSLKPTYDVLNSGPRNRFTIVSDDGPMIVHNCGYEGGVGAFLVFALTYNLDLEAMAEMANQTIPPEIWGQANIMLDWHKKKGRDPANSLGLTEAVWLTCESFKIAWRYAHPRITSYWKDLDEAFRESIEYPGVMVPCRKVKIIRKGAWLRIIMPSGRSMCYPSPAIIDGKITFMGVDQFTRKWSRQQTYGGKLSENIAQAFARDIMAYNMPEIERNEYFITLSVHDEVICETQDDDSFHEDKLSDLLAANPSWAADMPLAAAGFQTYRYKKG